MGDQIRIDGGTEDGFFVAQFADHLAHGVDDDRVAGITQVWIAAGAVGGDDIGLVLDGSGDAQRTPMGDAWAWPVGSEHEDLGALVDIEAEEFGETEVIADRRGDGECVFALRPCVGF